MSNEIDIRPRFRRSVRIDADYLNASAVDGFYCPPSFQQAVQFMARHVGETGQSAFTWTGPYGGGKSSLALALACLTGATKNVRERASTLFGDPTVLALKEALPYFPSRWDVLPLVAEKRSITKQIAEALGLDGRRSAKAVLKELETRSEKRGLLLILDELGRGLEAAAEGDGDIHILQDIAELASRSGGRLVFIGVLHQSFEEYADKLGRDARDSWAKIQGRFVDISIAVSLEESIELIAQAMGNAHTPKGIAKIADTVVTQLRQARSKSAEEELASYLAKCAPLHPLVTCLLGPLSRRRFGQNQRSVFSFLHSSEPFGLQDISNGDDTPTLYPTYRLWDYVKANFEGAVLSSPDGRRWATAADALERCIARGGSEIEINLLKSIGILELLKDRSGLTCTNVCLAVAFNDIPDKQINTALRSLERHSEIVFRKHANAYVLYAGSDFDIDANLETVLAAQDTSSVALIQSLADLQPLLAKRHHWQTGAMRWFDLVIDTVENLSSTSDFSSSPDSIGRIVLVVPDKGEIDKEIDLAINAALQSSDNFPVIVGYAQTSYRLVELGNELSGLRQLENSHPELRGDAVARREIDARTADLKRRIEEQVQALLEQSTWYRIGKAPGALSKRDFSELLSTIADTKFPNSPKLQNELLNCSAPSSNAVSARTKLMKRMVLKGAERDLGFSGKNYPAERGLYVSLLNETAIHCSEGDGGEYREPPKISAQNLLPVWREADRLLDSAKSSTVTAAELIKAWNAPPIGMKPGLGPVYVVAYALSRKDRVAVYGEGLFQSSFNELCVEYLARNPADIGFRKVEMEGLTGDILRNLGDLLKLQNRTEPLFVAREIVGQYDELVPWTGRTQSLSPQTLKVREILKRANDPNKLLFDDLPSLSEPKKDGTFDAKLIARILRDALAEMRAAYPNTLAELKALMLNELDVRAETSDALSELRSRADNIKHIGGDLRLDAFIGRITQFHGTDEDMEGIASIAASKLPRDWNDGDRERAQLELAQLAETFLKLETLARVKGRKGKRQALAVMVGRESTPLPMFGEFQVSDADHKDISALVTAVDKALSKADHKRREIILAALVEVTARYLEDENNPLLENLA